MKEDLVFQSIFVRKHVKITQKITYMAMGTKITMKESNLMDKAKNLKY